jgi:hypothetical protein
MKRGQATIFIIVGLVIAIIVVLSLFFFGTFTPAQEITQRTQIDEEKDIITDCLISLTEEGITLLNSQAGSLDPTYLDYNDQQIPYLTTFTKDYYINNLEMYITEHISLCELESSYETTYTDFQIEIELNEEVEATTTWSVTFKDEESEYIEQDFDFRLNKNLNPLLDSVVGINQAIRDSICITCIADIGEENEIEILMDYYEENVLFILDDSFLFAKQL